MGRGNYLMIQLQRLQLPKKTFAEVEPLAREVTAEIVRLVHPEKVILFGSAVDGRFDEASDLDFVVVFKTHEEASLGRAALYRNGHIAGRIIDFLCVDEETFRTKSGLGGVYFVAAQDGLALIPRFACVATLGGRFCPLDFVLRVRLLDVPRGHASDGSLVRPRHRAKSAHRYQLRKRIEGLVSLFFAVSATRHRWRADLTILDYSQ